MRLAAAVLAACWLASSGRAMADDPTAADLKQRGDDAMHALHYREALDLYDRAYATSHDPAVLYNRARAEQGLGDFPAALDAIEEFVRSAPDDLKRRVPKLAELVADIRDHVGMVVIVSEVSGATVRLQGKTVGTTPLGAPVKVSAGSVAVSVEAAGHPPFHEDITVAGGQVTTVEATFAPSPTVTPPPPPPPPLTRTERYVPGGYRAATFTVGAVGLVSLALGATFGGLVASKTGDASGHCPSKACDPTGWADIQDARTFATVSTATFIAGAVLVAGAIVMLIASPHKARPLVMGATF